MNTKGVAAERLALCVTLQLIYSILHAAVMSYVLNCYTECLFRYVQVTCNPVYHLWWEPMCLCAWQGKHPRSNEQPAFWPCRRNRSKDQRAHGPVCYKSRPWPYNCWNLLHFILCVSLYCPWNYTVWCGPFSKDFLKSAIALACNCENANNCRVNGFDISCYIDKNLNKYFHEEPADIISQSVKIAIGKWHTHAYLYETAQWHINSYSRSSIIAKEVILGCSRNYVLYASH